MPLKTNCFGLSLIILFFIQCRSPVSLSQELKGSSTLPEFPNKTIFLWEIIGSHSYKVDSALISEKGFFSFPTAGLPEGYYFLSLNDSSRADVIINPAEKEILLEFNDLILQNGIQVISSDENKLLWEYKFISKSVYSLLRDIYIEKSYYPVPPQSQNDSTMLNSLQDREDSLNNYKMQHLQRICSHHPGSFFARSAKAALRKKYSGKEGEKLHFFESVDFSDVSLVRSNAFPSNMMDYLQKYTEYSEDGFKSSVDTILLKAKASPEAYEFCLNYLLELFDRVGPDVIFQYLSEKYLIGDGCSEIDVSKSFKEKAEQYRLLLPGNKIPEISIPDMDGKDINLPKIIKENKFTVVFFWSSHCNFCHKAIPDLKNIFSEYKSHGLEVIAVSLDENKSDWEKYIQSNELTWINLSDLKGWQGEAVKKYKIHKTPSYYLIDRELTIMAKPSTVQDMAGELKKRM